MPSISQTAYLPSSSRYMTTRRACFYDSSRVATIAFTFLFKNTKGQSSGAVSVPGSGNKLYLFELVLPIALAAAAELLSLPAPAADNADGPKFVCKRD